MPLINFILHVCEFDIEAISFMQIVKNNRKRTWHWKWMNQTHSHHLIDEWPNKKWTKNTHTQTATCTHSSNIFPNSNSIEIEINERMMHRNRFYCIWTAANVVRWKNKSESESKTNIQRTTKLDVVKWYKLKLELPSTLRR